MFLFCAASLFAADQPFKSGSNGSYGPLDIQAATTLDMPPDGIFHCTTIRISSILLFKKNALNTPVYLLATGDVVIEERAMIDVSAELNRTIGGPGGFAGGEPAFQEAPPGDGHGPGAGKAISGARSVDDHPHGVFASSVGGSTNVYGNSLLLPLVGGSGGAAVNGLLGGGGGGAILIASDTKIVIDGQIIASGTGYGDGGFGSGGAIRIVAPIVSGSGELIPWIRVPQGREPGNGGWSRIDSLDRFAYRNLRLKGRWSRGSQMIVFPPNPPRLDIVEAAGTIIPVGAAAPVDVKLSVGSPETQTVKVQGTNFTDDTPITVAVTPENGPSARYDGTIPKPVTGNTSIAAVEVKIPVDTVCHVHVWTR